LVNKFEVYIGFVVAIYIVGHFAFMPERTIHIRIAQKMNNANNLKLHFKSFHYVW